jgi:hypothetical protein
VGQLPAGEGRELFQPVRRRFDGARRARRRQGAKGQGLHQARRPAQAGGPSRLHQPSRTAEQSRSGAPLALRGHAQRKQAQAAGKRLQPKPAPEGALQRAFQAEAGLFREHLAPRRPAHGIGQPAQQAARRQRSEHAPRASQTQGKILRLQADSALHRQQPPSRGPQLQAVGVFPPVLQLHGVAQAALGRRPHRARPRRPPAEQQRERGEILPHLLWRITRPAGAPLFSSLWLTKRG